MTLPEPPELPLPAGLAAAAALLLLVSVGDPMTIVFVGLVVADWMAMAEEQEEATAPSCFVGIAWMCVVFFGCGFDCLCNCGVVFRCDSDGM